MALALAGLGAGTPAAGAATITVTVQNDPAGSTCPGPNCSLRQAATTATPGETVSLPAGTYTLSQGQISVDKALIFAGAGAGSTTVTTSTTARLFFVGTNGHVTFTGITFTGGHAPSTPGNPGTGGAIDNRGGVSLTRDAFVSNTADGAAPSLPGFGGPGGQGGAVFSRGKTTISQCSFSGDVAGGGGVGSTTNGFGGSGGAIYSDGVLGVTRSSFDNETAQAGTTAAGHTGGVGGSGGAIISDGGTVRISSTTFGAAHVNTAAGGATAPESGFRFASGGAISASNTDLRLSTDRFVANEAGGGVGTSPSTFGHGGEGGALWADAGRTSIAGTTFGS
ncbi:MAG: hypothetical protein ACJ764_12535, partial [Solirubrobacteraceae bacterium]